MLCAATTKVVLQGSGDADTTPRAPRREAWPALIDSLSLANANGDRSAGIRAGEEIRVRALVEAGERFEKLSLRLELRDDSDELLFAPPGIHLTPDDSQLEPGEAVHIEATIENKLRPGRYTVTCTAWGPGRTGRSGCRTRVPSTSPWRPVRAGAAERCSWITRCAWSAEERARHGHINPEGRWQ